MAIRERLPRPVVAGLLRGLAVGLLGFVAYLGGVSATQLWPVHAQTRYFAADVAVEPRLDSTVELPTVVGDVVITFDGPVPAPGLSAQVQVRDEVTDLLRSGRLRSADLQPDRAELRGAIDGAVREVAWKFVAGASAPPCSPCWRMPSPAPTTPVTSSWRRVWRRRWRWPGRAVRPT